MFSKIILNFYKIVIKIGRIKVLIWLKCCSLKGFSCRVNFVSSCSILLNVEYIRAPMCVSEVGKILVSIKYFLVFLPCISLGYSGFKCLGTVSSLAVKYVFGICNIDGYMFRYHEYPEVFIFLTFLR